MIGGHFHIVYPGHKQHSRAHVDLGKTAMSNNGGKEIIVPLLSRPRRPAAGM